MKIGEFARLHNVSQDTIRHYINEGLLTPLKENTQYSFSECDSDIMRIILLLKEMNFKLDEMKAYLLYAQIRPDNRGYSLRNFEEYFKEKIEENKREIERLAKMNELIEKKLTEAKRDDLIQERGIALSLMEDIRCPDCNLGLELINPRLVHNEIIEGEMVCPKCGKRYYIRYGVISDKPIKDYEEDTEDVSDLMKEYIKVNGDDYVSAIREAYQKNSEMVKDYTKNAKTIAVSSNSSLFLITSLFRSIKEDVRLIVYTNDYNIARKEMLNCYFPKEALVYSGDLKNIPIKVPADFIVYDDYDYDSYSKVPFTIYPYRKEDTILNCFKTIFLKNPNIFPTKEKFLEDFRNMGYVKIDEYKSNVILNKKESIDYTVLEDDEKIQLAIYTFKTLG